MALAPCCASHRVRPLRRADLPALLQLQAACYGAGLIEGPEVYARRLARADGLSLAATDAQGGLLAYLAAYASVPGQVTPLQGDFESPPQADTLYLHDLAVHPDHGGRGLAASVLNAAWQAARQRGLRQAALVSVQGTRRFWERQGFAVAHTLAPELAAYGPQALYMQKRLTS